MPKTGEHQRVAYENSLFFRLAVFCLLTCFVLCGVLPLYNQSVEILGIGLTVHRLAVFFGLQQKALVLV